MLTRYVTGVRLLGQGAAACARSPRMLLLGLLPAVVTALLFGAALLVLLLHLADLAGTVTWFAADWTPAVRVTARVVAGVGLLGVAILLVVLTFTTVTLMIGDPCYEAISRHMDGEVAGEVETGFWRGLGRSVAESVRLLAVAVPAGVPLFLAGLLPLVGQTVVPVVGATVGGWFLALQLTAVPFERRGWRLADRRRMLRGHRPEALGFGTAVFVCFLIPGGAVLVMPAAVAGGTLLARHVLSRPIMNLTS